jgi:tetratricopeptide (TPR) repeat protein
MKSESIVFAVAGMCFGVILGWVMASQQLPAQAPAPAAQPSAAGQSSAPVLDEGKVQALMTIVKNDPNNASAHAQLGNAYFDAERWPEAIQWYEQALKLDPNNPDVSTDLGVSYYYTNRADDALAQFDRSLAIDPKHTKTMLNKGIVLAFGKQDLASAAEEWKKVVELAPDSPEGQAARRALEGVAAAHAGESTGTP